MMLVQVNAARLINLHALLLNDSTIIFFSMHACDYLPFTLTATMSFLPEDEHISIVGSVISKVSSRYR